MYLDKNYAIQDYLHKITRYLVNYCKENSIHTVVAGDITNIRKGKNLGKVTNQKFHALPYKKLYKMLKYKFAKEGIRFILQKESYSSQTSPLKPDVCKENAEKHKRVKRGLYQDESFSWNADCVGAFNILRLYFQTNGMENRLNPMEIKSPYIVKVAV